MQEAWLVYVGRRSHAKPLVVGLSRIKRQCQGSLLTYSSLLLDILLFLIIGFIRVRDTNLISLFILRLSFNLAKSLLADIVLYPLNSRVLPPSSIITSILSILLYLFRQSITLIDINILSIIIRGSSNIQLIANRAYNLLNYNEL